MILQFLDCGYPSFLARIHLGCPVGSIIIWEMPLYALFYPGILQFTKFPGRALQNIHCKGGA
jgi:hypothetical protein